MPQHTRRPSSSGKCPSGFVRRGGICVRKDLVEKVGERQPGESKEDCVSRKIPILIGEGMKEDQATAVANELCKLEKNFWGVFFNCQKSEK